ncbi:outer membrane surface antigen [Paraburkholderia sp. BL8N3]|nr:RT0821/Lpp0805 family surface protein [Paraburkholderia sp. BL8N3]TCK43030.1 outer membrane surface antigen [Paraburkholderia sp. BL8N3]
MPLKLRTLTRVSAQSIAAFALIAASVAASAANLGFLNDTPLTYMKQRDLQALNSAARTALETKEDGQSLEWSNQGAGNPVPIKGTVTPLDTVKDGDRTCRKITLVAIAKGQTQTWTPTACKTGNGKWQLQKQ